MRISRAIISESLAWTALAAFLAIGVPLFLCMPLWVDTTYHDLSARNVLWGGVHYRDIFETNLPGMVWVHAALRPLIGWSSEAIRAADLVVGGVSVMLLICWLGRLGVSRANRIWFAAAMTLFYVYDTQFIHCQRDMWMLLPALVALHLRGRQLCPPTLPSPRKAGGREKLDSYPTASGVAPSYPPPGFAGGMAPSYPPPGFAGGGQGGGHFQNRGSNAKAFRRAMLEGVAWACAVWIKPHCLIPALVVWLVSVRPLIGAGSPRLALFDFLGLLAGGLLAGGIGSFWLIQTGAWPYMWDVLLNWNAEYYDWSLKEMDGRVSMVIMYFSPWSLVHYASLPMAVVALIRARVWRSEKIDPIRIGRVLIAALYLGWFLQATFLQKGFHYSNAPVLILAFAVLASQRWPAAQIFVAWSLLGGLLHYYNDRDPSLLPALTQFEKERPNTAQQLVPRNKLLNREWKSVWRRCLHGSDPELKDYLSFYRYNHCTPGWRDLDRVRQYLETLNLKHGELLCWDDSTHPLYLDLQLRPAIRYPHVNTVLDFRSKRDVIRQEVINSGAQYVVADLMVGWYFYDYCSTWELDSDAISLPADFPCFCREIFPWNQTIVFRAGRYVVFRIDKPIGEIRLPYPARMDKP